MTHIFEPVGRHDLSRAQYRFWIVGVARQGSLAVHWVGFTRRSNGGGHGREIVWSSACEWGWGAGRRGAADGSRGNFWDFARSVSRTRRPVFIVTTCDEILRQCTSRGGKSVALSLVVRSVCCRE